MRYKNFTTPTKGGIIQNVKKAVILTTALAAIIACAPTYVFAAQTYAEETQPEETQPEECNYPTSFSNTLSFASLTDYAVSGDVRAYAESTKLYIIKPDEYGDERLTTVDCGFELKRLDYDDAGTLYIQSAEGISYRYPDLAPSDYVFSPITDAVTIGNFLYILSAGSLMSFDSGNNNANYTIFDEKCSNLKEYDGTAYVMNDGSVYALSGTSAVAAPPTYTDFSSSYSLPAGNSAQVLLSDYTVKTVVIKPQTEEGYDTYCTRIDLTEIGETFKSTETIKITADRSALAIAETGNATIIIMADENGRGASYITLTSALETSAYSPPASDMNGAYILMDTTVYSRPYMCGATALSPIPAGSIVEVKEKFELRYLDTVFYRVTYNDGQKDVTGFVAAGYLTPYQFSAEDQPQQTTGNGNFTYDNDIQTVIIVLLIVGLVIIAIAYLTVIGTRGSKNKKRRRKEKAPSRRDDDLYED